MSQHAIYSGKRSFNSLRYTRPTDCCTLTTKVVDTDADNCAAMLKDPKIVEVRRMKLQTYLRLVIAQLSRDFPELIEHACRQTLVQTVPFFSYVSLSYSLLKISYYYHQRASIKGASNAFTVSGPVADKGRLQPVGDFC